MKQTRSLLWNSTSYKLFKNSILKFMRSSPIKTFQCHNPKGIRLVTRLSFSLSHLWEYKFKHSSWNTLNPLCCYDLATKSASHYLLHCPLFHTEWSTLLNNIKEINSTILNKSESFVTCILTKNLSRLK